MKIIIKIKRETYTNDDAIYNALNYIFGFDQPQPMPIRFYGNLGLTEYPPDPGHFIRSFEQLREGASHTISRKLWHIIISFPTVFPQPYGRYFYFADAVARLFGPYYPVAYSYHKDNRHTQREHSHFHLIISTTSASPALPPLSRKKLNSYLPQIIAIAHQYGLTTQIIGQ